MSLPIATNCDGCGCCCLEQVAPPGYLAIIAGVGTAEDLVLYNAMPQTLQDELEAYHESLHDPDRREGIEDQVCIWFDVAENRCKNYDHRPTICRDAIQAGDKACQVWRIQYAHTVTE